MNSKKLFGDFFKGKRIEESLSLREFCKKHQLDPGNVSKLERGILAPPKSMETLKEYAKYLGITEESPDWTEYFDLAAASKGEIPHEILNDDDLAKKLPLIFKVIRERKDTLDLFDNLIEVIKSS